MITWERVAVAVVGSVVSLSALGAETHAPQGAGDKVPGPVISERADWAPQVLGIIGILFVSAVPVGLMRRWYMPEEPQVEDFHSHDEPPGASHHHGASGTIDHSAPDQPHHH
jgi:hypothetical protein